MPFVSPRRSHNYTYREVQREAYHMRKGNGEIDVENLAIGKVPSDLPSEPPEDARAFRFTSDYQVYECDTVNSPTTMPDGSIVKYITTFPCRWFDEETSLCLEPSSTTIWSFVEGREMGELHSEKIYKATDITNAIPSLRETSDDQPQPILILESRDLFDSREQELTETEIMEFVYLSVADRL